MSSAKKVPIPETEFIPLKGAKIAGRPKGRESIQVTVVLRPRKPTPTLHDDEFFSTQPPRLHRYLTTEEYADKHGAHPDDLDRLKNFAREHHFEIVETSQPWRSIVLRGTCANFSRTFNVEMVHYDHPRGFHRGITGPVHVPEDLREVIQAVLGLHNRPIVRRHSANHSLEARGFSRPSMLEVAELYSFPKAVNSAQHIGVLEFGGGYHRSDISKYFSSLKMAVPRIRDVSVHGAVNTPANLTGIKRVLHSLDSSRAPRGGPSSRAALANRTAAPAHLHKVQDTIETTMDIEIAGALAGGAQISVYFAHNSEQGMFNALRKALEDRRAGILSISWGEPEPSLTKSYLNLVNDLLRDAAHLGVTVCASSGDAGALNGSPRKRPTVNFPASSPYVLGCGGTTPHLSGSKVLSEAAWNSTYLGLWGATGGGVSRHFGLPLWQEKHHVPSAPTRFRGRGVPDVAGPADPNRGFRIVVGGSASISGGTSAVAPLWAGLLARINHVLGTNVGYLTPHLYHLATTKKKLFREVEGGNNGAYVAGPGWNPCTGLGSPRGKKLLAVLSSRG